MATFNLADLFELVADAVPDRQALVAGDDRLTYSELADRATRFANHLRARGVEPGEHIAILGWNSRSWFEAMLGTFSARCAVVNVNYRYTRAEVVEVLVDSEAAALVGDPELLDDLGDLSTDAPRLRHTMSLGVRGSAEVGFEEALAAADPQRSGRRRSGDDPYLLYTGGTTGRPKGVVWRSEDIFFAALGGGNPGKEPIAAPEQVLDHLWRVAAPWFVTSPLMHGNGQWNSLMPLLNGRGVVLWTERGFDALEVARIAAAEAVQLLVLVGDGMAVPFLEAIEAEADLDLTGLARIASGGAILSPTSKERLQARLPGCVIVDAYGASETGGGGLMIGSNGPMPRFMMTPDVAVLDDELEPVPVGHVGKLARRGRLPVGYWNDPEKTASTFPTDRHGTRWSVPGDKAVLEADGTITLLGRGSATINTGGEKVHPDEVANRVKAHPGIADAVVVGVSDDRWGQAVTAVATAARSTRPDLSELVEHVRAALAPYKAPRHLVWVDHLPYTAQGKPDLAAARELAEAELGLSAPGAVDRGARPAGAPSAASGGASPAHAGRSVQHGPDVAPDDPLPLPVSSERRSDPEGGSGPDAGSGPIRFAGKVALLTGAASGIGRATALRLSAEGAAVFAVDIDEVGLEALALEARGPVEFQRLDVTDVEGCRRAVADCVARFGRLDILGNIAGIVSHVHVAEVGEAEWDRMLDVNLKGPFFLTQAALPHLLETGGNVINMASNAGLMGQAYTVPYCASKGGLVNLTRALAAEFVTAPIRVNAIAPAGVDTAIAQNFEMAEGADFDLMRPYIGHRGQASAEDIAGIFAFLASEEAASIHGAIVSADQGVSAY